MIARTRVIDYAIQPPFSLHSSALLQRSDNDSQDQSDRLHNTANTIYTVVLSCKGVTMIARTRVIDYAMQPPFSLHSSTLL